MLFALLLGAAAHNDGTLCTDSGYHNHDESGGPCGGNCWTSTDQDCHDGAGLRDVKCCFGMCYSGNPGGQVCCGREGEPCDGGPKTTCARESPTNRCMPCGSSADCGGGECAEQEQMDCSVSGLFPGGPTSAGQCTPGSPANAGGACYDERGCGAANEEKPGELCIPHVRQGASCVKAARANACGACTTPADCGIAHGPPWAPDEWDLCWPSQDPGCPHEALVVLELVCPHDPSQGGYCCCGPNFDENACKASGESDTCGPDPTSICVCTDPSPALGTTTVQLDAEDVDTPPANEGCASCIAAAAECGILCACDYPACECCAECGGCIADKAGDLSWEDCCTCIHLCDEEPDVARLAHELRQLVV